MGLVHVAIGVIAIVIAIGSSSREADDAGAMQIVKDAPVGAHLPSVIALGLTALV